MNEWKKKNDRQRQRKIEKVGVIERMAKILLMNVSEEKTGMSKREKWMNEKSKIFDKWMSKWQKREAETKERLPTLPWNSSMLHNSCILRFSVIETTEIEFICWLNCWLNLS